MRENLKAPSRTILTVGFAGLKGVLLLISALKALIAIKPEMAIRKQPKTIRNFHAQLAKRNGNKYSRKTPAPKHAKNISGGGILTAALSCEFISILILILHLM
ncbi:MAG: hypothetical protein ABFD82_02870 [Syntrophaceae bacterium]